MEAEILSDILTALADLTATVQALDDSLQDTLYVLLVVSLANVFGTACLLAVQLLWFSPRFLGIKL